MRVKIAAALILAPALMHAQADSTSNAPVYMAKAVAPAAEGVATHSVRITTGVSAPTLIYKADIAPASYGTAQHDKVIVSLMVDRQGAPTNIHVVNSSNALLNSRVVSAVSQYRFKPGMLDHQNVEVPMTLQFLFQ